MSADNKKPVNDIINKILTKRNGASSNSFQVLGNLLKAIENPAEQADNKEYQETLKSLQEIVNKSASNLVKDKIAEIAQAPAKQTSQESEAKEASGEAKEDKPAEITHEQLAKIQEHLQEKIEEQLKQILPTIVKTQINNETVPLVVQSDSAENSQVPVETEKPAEEIQELVEYQMKELIDKLVPEIVKEKQAEAPKQETDIKEEAPQLKLEDNSNQQEATNANSEADNQQDSLKQSVQGKIEGMVDEKLPVIVDEKLADIVEKKLAEQLIKEEKKQFGANTESQNPTETNEVKTDDQDAT
jgi:hypothetical protein